MLNQHKRCLAATGLAVAMATRAARLRSRRAISVVAALTITVPITLAATSARAATGQHPVTAASEAPRLAKAVAEAKTTAARVAAIDHIMAVLHIDVINPANGAVVVPGAARSLNDAYLYTSEVQRLAVAYANRDRVTLTTLAGELGLVYAKLGVRLTAGNLGAGITKVIKAEARSAEPDSVALLARLVWQLGLLDKPAQNLAGNVKPASIRLDPLQAWLIAAEFTFPLIYANKPPSRPASRLPALTDGLVQHSAAPSINICDALKQIKEGLGFSDKMAMETAAEAVGQSFKWSRFLLKAAPFVSDLIDTVHGALTGIGIQIGSAISPAKTSLGGPPMHLAVSVTMTLPIPAIVVRCGWLSGDDFPGHGPVPGVVVLWDNSTLSPWGTFTCHECHKTGTDGTARETFTPGPEQVHHGLTVIERGTVTAVTFPNTSMGNYLGFLADLIRDQGAMVWELSHRKTGYPTGFTADVHWAYAIDSADYKIIAVKHPAYKNDCTANFGCTYAVQHIYGTASEYGGCKVTIPPYHITFENLSIQQLSRHGGGLYWAILFQVSFHTGTPSGPPGTTCGPYFDESAWAAEPNGEFPPYEFGEIDTTFDLAYGGDSGPVGGTAKLSFQY